MYRLFSHTVYELFSEAKSLDNRQSQCSAMYGLLMRNHGYIEFETLEKTVLVISKEY
jgi:hypothetical protein